MEKFHFQPEFDADVDPEFPGNGDWGCAVHGFGREGAVVEDFRSTWGTPLIVEVELRDEARWIGMFEAGGLGGVTGLFATPDPLHLCAVVDGLAYLVDVRRPEAGALPAKSQVHQVAAVTNEPLLLLVRMIDITAIGSDGVAWNTPRLAVDDLRVENTDDGVITCSLDNLGGTATISLDSHTGEQLGGTRLDSFWPRDAL